MLNAALLEHPVVRACVDALVETRGGLVVYELGMAGREILVASGVQIALATGKPLTIIQAEPLRTATADLIDQLGPVEYTFLSPKQAADWPAGFAPDSVLAMHGDALRKSALLDPLLNPLHAAAQDAHHRGHLVIARHPYASPVLDTYATQTRLIRAEDSTPAPTARAATRMPDTSSARPDSEEHVRRLPESGAKPGPAGPDPGGTMPEPGTGLDMWAGLRDKPRSSEILNPDIARPHKADPVDTSDLVAAFEDPLTRHVFRVVAAALGEESRARIERARLDMESRVNAVRQRRSAPEQQDQNQQHTAARPEDHGGPHMI